MSEGDFEKSTKHKTARTYDSVRHNYLYGYFTSIHTYIYLYKYNLIYMSIFGNYACYSSSPLHFTHWIYVNTHVHTYISTNECTYVYSSKL